MKALLLTEYNHFAYTDVPEPEIGPDDALIRVRACGICGSDIHGMDGSSGRRNPPLIMGHEAAGVIAWVGHQVSRWQPGDRVTFDSTIYCGECYFCRRGQINLCDHRRVLGVSCDEYRQHGALAEYVAVPQRILYHLPDKVSFVHGAMVEPVSIAVHAASRVPVNLDDTVVVFGAGMIGLLVIQVLKIAGCGRVIAVDLADHRLQLARQLGADEGLRSDRDDVIGEVCRLTGGRGADLAFEVVGITPTVRLAVQSLKKGGMLALVGNLSPQVELPLQAVVTRQLTLAGSAASCGQYPACLNMMGRGSLNLNAIISAVAPLREGATWFARLYQREENLLKVILEPT
ncbi:MAG: galactitol-1-phosphate 5-dehydrogenase [Anaerolineae bacterium]|nr:galactitol-1-phosphate 5-dehydrogenase [Anaerolineae bacterium]